jgi:hypothetical protein
MEFRRLLIALIAIMAAGATHAQRNESPTLPAFPFDQPGDYEFHFRQAHSREMTLLLEVEPAEGEPQRVALTHLKTTIEVSLTDHRERRVCGATGVPQDGITKEGWVLRTSEKEAAFWHWSCAEIKLKRSELYTLTIYVRNVDPKTPKIKLTPIFERSDDFGL